MKIEYSKKAAKYISGVLAWDPDFTKVTPLERAEMESAKREIESGETVSHDAISWD